MWCVSTGENKIVQPERSNGASYLTKVSRDRSNAKGSLTRYEGISQQINNLAIFARLPLARLATKRANKMSFVPIRFLRWHLRKK